MKVKKSVSCDNNDVDVDVEVKNVRIAIVGGREFTNYEYMKQSVADFMEHYGLTMNRIECVVSGGAKGADRLAEQWADEFNIDKKIFKPDYKQHSGRLAPLKRNLQIVEYATHLIAFPSKNSKGTYHAVNAAKRNNLKVKCYKDWSD